MMMHLGTLAVTSPICHLKLERRTLACSSLGLFYTGSLATSTSANFPRRSRGKITPGQFFLEACDGKFTDEDLSELGNRFAEHYYEHEDTPGHYFADYAATVGIERPSIYNVPDTWETYEQLAPIIQQRFEEWQRTDRT
jgi:hypothetical protein